MPGAWALLSSLRGEKQLNCYGLGCQNVFLVL